MYRLSFEQSFVTFQKIRQFQMMDSAVIGLIHKFSEMRPDLHNLENMIAEDNMKMFEFLLENISFNRNELTSAVEAAVRVDNLSAVEKLMEKLETLEIDDFEDDPDYIWTAVENDSVRCYLYFLEYNDPPESYIDAIADVAAQNNAHNVLRYILAEIWVDCERLLDIAERNGSQGIIDFLNDEYA